MNNIYKKIVCMILYKIYFWKTETSGSLLVLTYHRIVDEPNQDPLSVSRKNFENQILFFKKHYNIISGEQLVEIIKNKEPFPLDSCLITFDDGWRDNYTNAYPILRKHKVPSVIFISTDYIGTNRMFWHEQLAYILEKKSSNVDSDTLSEMLDDWHGEIAAKIERAIKVPVKGLRSVINDLINDLIYCDREKISKLIQKLATLLGVDETGNSPSMLSWEQVIEMSQSNICFGSHTKSHPILTQISVSSVVKELNESKEIIENKIGKPVCLFAYPNGDHNESIINIMEKTGYFAAFTCLTGISYGYKKRFELKRKSILEDFSLGLYGNFSDLFFRVELSLIRDYLSGWKKF